jgi:RimJ/RimL family protein N-acetyltransferase
MKNPKNQNAILLDLPMPIRTPRLLLRHYIPGDGPELDRAVQESFNELTHWMPWAETLQTGEESETFVRTSFANWQLREDLTLGIYEPTGKVLLGCTGLHRIDWSVPPF